MGEQPSGSFTQEIGKDVLFGREGTQNSRTRRPADEPSSSQSCVPVSVADKDEDVKEAKKFRVQEPVEGLKLILIERHFMPTCSRITSTTHPAIIRSRCSVNFAM